MYKRILQILCVLCCIFLLGACKIQYQNNDSLDSTLIVNIYNQSDSPVQNLKIKLVDFNSRETISELMVPMLGPGPYSERHIPVYLYNLPERAGEIWLEYNTNNGEQKEERIQTIVENTVTGGEEDVTITDVLDDGTLVLEVKEFPSYGL